MSLNLLLGVAVLVVVILVLRRIGCVLLVVLLGIGLLLWWQWPHLGASVLHGLPMAPTWSLPMRWLPHLRVSWSW